MKKLEDLIAIFEKGFRITPIYSTENMKKQKKIFINDFFRTFVCTIYFFCRQVIHSLYSMTEIDTNRYIYICILIRVFVAVNMHQSNVNLLDLPNEILLKFF